MSEFRIGQAAALLGVSADTVRRWIDDGRLHARRTEGGHRVIEGATLAAFARSLFDAGREGGSRSSARNQFVGLVTDVKRGDVVAQVEMQAGPHRIVSLMTREAADALGLEPGALAVASVKATNVVIEVRAGA